MVTLSAIVLFLCLTLIHVEWAASEVLNLNCKQIRQFVDGHNTRRLQVANGKVVNQPAATKMASLLWDNELAKKAAEWASHNEFQHNPNKTIPSGRFTTGENLYIYYTTADEINYQPKDALDSWFGEYKDYKYKALENSDFYGEPQIGHYTQMVWAKTHYVGCAASQYRENGWNTMLTVCNYGPAGNYIGEKPYESGKPGKKLSCGVKDCSRLYGDKCSY